MKHHYFSEERQTLDFLSRTYNERQTARHQQTLQALRERAARSYQS